MTIEDQITALLAEAVPLRLLPDEEAEKRGLPAIVDRINALRLLESQAKNGEFMVKPETSAAGKLFHGPLPLHGYTEDQKSELSANALRFDADREEAKKRKPGRPPKAKPEGADA